MPKKCPKCGEPMLPADLIDNEKSNWVCPECAPDFVLANATSFETETEDPLV